MDWGNKLIHTISRWEPSTTIDAYGKISYSVNDTFIGRWMYKTSLITNSEGKELVSNAIIYTTTPINNQSYLEFDTITGDTNPTIRPNARLVMKVEKHYDLNATETMYKVYL